MKLFSLEEDTTNILQQANNPLELTKILINQKEEIKKQLKNKFLNKEDEKEKEKDTESSKDTEKDVQKESKEETSDSKEDKEESLDDIEKESKEIDKESKEGDKEDSSDEGKKYSGKEESNEKESKDSKKDEEDASEIASDKESLKSIIGSAVSNEHISLPSFKNTKYLKSVYLAYEQYLSSLARYSKLKPISLEEQKVVYIKESIVESLTKIIVSLHTYIAKNNSFIVSSMNNLKELNKEITTFSEALPNTNYAFNLKLIRDEDILLNLSINDKTDIRATLKSINDFTENTSKLVSLILNNDFSNINDSFLNSNFKSEGEELEYSSALPALNIIKAVIPNYIDYTKTDISKYEVYRIQHIKQESLNNLTALEISSDADLEYIINNANTILFNLSKAIENLTIVNTNANTLIEKLKALIFDIENNKVTNLAELGIDNIFKQIIQFKLLMDVINVQYRIVYDYLNSLVRFLKLTVEVKLVTNPQD